MFLRQCVSTLTMLPSGHVLMRTVNSVDLSPHALYRYSWWRNHNLLDFSAVHIQRVASSSEGLSVRLDPLTSADEGTYQCMANNSFGTALSEVIYLQEASITEYPASKYHTSL